MAKYCPILKEKVVYLVCLECEDKLCEVSKHSKDKHKEEKKKGDK